MVGFNIMSESRLNTIVEIIQEKDLKYGYVVADISGKDTRINIFLTDRRLCKNFRRGNFYRLRVNPRPWYDDPLVNFTRVGEYVNFSPDARMRYKLDFLRIRWENESADKFVLLNTIPSSRILWTVKEVVGKYNRIITAHKLSGESINLEDLAGDVIGWTGEYDFEKEATPCP